jgi:hypothetical protein
MRCTSPEQSKPVPASVPPQAYGTPRYRSAACTTAEPLPLAEPLDEAAGAPAAVSPAAEAALVHAERAGAVGVMRNRVWISLIRLCTALSPSTSVPPLCVGWRRAGR